MRDMFGVWRGAIRASIPPASTIKGLASAVPQEGAMARLAATQCRSPQCAVRKRGSRSNEHLYPSKDAACATTW
jgi:hypothetical protein